MIVRTNAHCAGRIWICLLKTRNNVGNNLDVVFFVGCAWVFALAPLSQDLRISNAHDRSPAVGAAVVFVGRVAVVAQSKCVTDFVRCGFSNALRAAKVVGEDVSRSVAVPGERTKERNAAGGLAIPI